jgi:hypothetical protein
MPASRSAGAAPSASASRVRTRTPGSRLQLSMRRTSAGSISALSASASCCDVRGALVQPARRGAPAALDPASLGEPFEPRPTQPTLELRAARVAQLRLVERRPALADPNQNSRSNRAYAGEGTSEIGEGTSPAAGTSAGTKRAETTVRTGFAYQANCP